MPVLTITEDRERDVQLSNYTHADGVRDCEGLTDLANDLHSISLS